MEVLINKIFDKNLPSVEDIFKNYPFRNIKDGAKITRIAPSPTGFVHLGTIYMGLVSERIAHISGGIFFIRIEDTDSKREKDGSADALANSFQEYRIIPDEGFVFGGKSIGEYGPYKQSERKDIYKVFIKELMKQGLAYPCFCTEEELENIINQQKAQNCSRLGYYGNWAKYRNFPAEEAIKKIDAGEEYVIRFKSFGDFNKKIIVNDLIKGNREFPENDLDIVIMKKNGLPTYHFAHVIDDFLMGTNLVTRGDEWFPSLPLHMQLFKAMNWKAPKYAHISPIMKVDGDGKRKLSKRKDPEANVEFYDQEGYPILSIIEYCMNLGNSNFEDWRKQNPTLDYKEFPFDIKKMNTSGSLFDFVKLNSVSRDVISRMSATEIYDKVLIWSEKYDKELFNLVSNNKDYTIKIFNIERENTKKPRKDIAKWNEVKNEIIYFFKLDKDEVSKNLAELDKNDIKKISELFLKTYNIEDDNQIWFEKIKDVAKQVGYAENMKEFKEHPEDFKGSVADVAKILRILVTGREQSPDLCSGMKILGKEEVVKRLSYN